MSQQPESHDFSWGSREVDNLENVAHSLKCEELQASNELLYEQIASLRAELAEKNEQLESLELELNATNHEIDLINQELQSHKQQASLALPEALEVAQQLLLVPVTYRDAIAQLLSIIYATDIKPEQLNSHQTPQITPPLRLALVKIWNAYQRRRLRNQFIEVGLRFVNAKGGHTQLMQKLRELNDPHSCSDDQFLEFVEVFKTSTADMLKAQ